MSQIVGIILNDDGYLQIKDGNIPFQVQYGQTNQDKEAMEEIVNITELYCTNDDIYGITLYWNKDIIKDIEAVWTADICTANKSYTANKSDAIYLPPYLQNKNEYTLIYINDDDDDDDDLNLGSEIEIPRWDIKEEVNVVRENLKLNMDNPIYCDVKFEIGKSKLSNAAHKTIYGIAALFAAQSTVFEAQFYGSLVVFVIIEIFVRFVNCDR